MKAAESSFPPASGERPGQEVASAPSDAVEPGPPAPGRGRAAGQFVLFTVVAVAVAAALRFALGGATDPDSFYHLRHAGIYAERGLGTTQFPWLVYSIISRYASDIAYGFHLLLIPFARLRDPNAALAWSAVFETVAVLVMCYLAMRRHRLAYPWAWPFVLLLLGGPITYTFMMTRPQTLSMGFSALLLSSFIAGSSAGTAFSAFGISFTHLNISGLIPFIGGAAFLTRGLVEKVWDWRRVLLALGGGLVGWLLRPNPIGAAKIEYVQMLMQSAAREKGLPLLFGREWAPVPLGQAFSYFLYFSVIWIVLMVVFMAATALRRVNASPQQRSLLWSTLVLSVIFFVVLVVNTKRTTPLWATFAVLFSAAALTTFGQPRAQGRQFLSGDLRLMLALCVAVIFGLMVSDVAQQWIGRQWQGTTVYRMQAAAQAVARRSQPGDIVYDVDWGDFPELFFWDAKNYYVSGLDPIFLYAYDPALYWKTHHLAIAQSASFTSGAEDLRHGTHEDTVTVLRRDFHAAFVVLEKRQNPALYDYLRQHRGVSTVYDDASVAAFALGSRK